MCITGLVKYGLFVGSSFVLPSRHPFWLFQKRDLFGRKEKGDLSLPETFRIQLDLATYTHILTLIHTHRDTLTGMCYIYNSHSGEAKVRRHFEGEIVFSFAFLSFVLSLPALKAMHVNEMRR